MYVADDDSCVYSISYLRVSFDARESSRHIHFDNGALEATHKDPSKIFHQHHLNDVAVRL